MYKALTTKGSGKNQKVTNLPSSFQAKGKTKDVTAMVLRDYQRAIEIQNKNRTEFNNKSLLSEIEDNQKAFNSYVPPRSDDPDESWKAQTVRPITRNKLISIAAHITSTVLYPNVFAQNDRDDEDKDAAEVMKDLVEWVIDNSNYSRSFITAIISALVDPATIVNIEFAEVMRTVKEMKEDGTWSKKEIVDEILSGFAANVIPCKEILISNFFEPNLQKQRFIIRNRYIDHDDAEILYGKHENFKHVKPGVRAVFDQTTSTFYDVIDEDMKQYLDNEVTYYSRALDLKLTFINGILVCDPEYPNPRKDKLYPFAKTTYEPLNNGVCFYGKSAANKLGSDQNIVDTLYNMIIDGTFLQLMPPMALYGSEDIDSSVTIPGTVTSFMDPNTKLENIGPKSDIRAGLETIGLVERSIAESSQDNIRSGVSEGGSRTAREVLLLEQNARVAMGLFGKMVAFLVEDIGTLMVGDILQHMTVGQVEDITTGTKYKSFILPNKVVDGKKVTKKIEFSDQFFDKPEMTEGDLQNMQYDILNAEGGPDAEKKIYRVNPEIFRNYKYKIRVEPDDLTPKSKALDKALNLEAYDRAIQNPVTDQEAVTRDFLFEVYKPGESDKYIKKIDPNAQGPSDVKKIMNYKDLSPEGRAQMEEQAGFKQKGVNSNLVSQITGGNSLGTAASSDMQ